MSQTPSKKQRLSTKKKSAKIIPFRRPKPPLHKYQEQAVQLLLKNKFFGLLFSPGLGKTLCILEYFFRYKKKNPKAKMLVLAKLRICYSVWAEDREVMNWQYPFKVSILHGTKKDDLFFEDADIYITNYEMLKWLEPYLHHNKNKFDILVLDESSKVKDTRTNRFKILRRVLHHFKRRHILTGSPVPNGLENLFGQIYCLDEGEALGRYITSYRNEYFYPSGYGGYDYKLMPGAEDRIYKRVKPLVLRKGHELLELPPCVPVFHEDDLPASVQAVYDALEKDFIAEIQNGVITASTAAVASGKLRQVCSGGIYLDSQNWEDKILSDCMELLHRHGVAGLKIGSKTYNKGGILKNNKGQLITKEGRPWELLHNEKTEMLQEIVEELNGDPCLVAYNFQHDLERLLTAFPKTPYIGGGVSAKESARIEKDWNLGKYPLLFGHPGSIAHGLNLQGAGCNVVWYSLTWSLEDYEQLIQRVWRQGQKRKVFIHHLIMRGTIDEIMMRVIKMKDRNQKTFLKAMESDLDVKFSTKRTTTNAKKKTAKRTVKKRTVS